jgi:hypothetical protein
MFLEPEQLSTGGWWQEVIELKHPFSSLKCQPPSAGTADFLEQRSIPVLNIHTDCKMHLNFKTLKM